MADNKHNEKNENGDREKTEALRVRGEIVDRRRGENDVKKRMASKTEKTGVNDVNGMKPVIFHNRHRV
jgi:hypothetical protein